MAPHRCLMETEKQKSGMMIEGKIGGTVKMFINNFNFCTFVNNLYAKTKAVQLT